MDAAEDRLYLYGGRSSEGDWHNDLWAFDLHRRRWEELEGDCAPGEGCPPPAEASALISSGRPGSITMALGTPVVSWQGTEHEWRYLLATREWGTEDDLRGVVHRGPRPGPQPWCIAAGGDDPAGAGVYLAVLAFSAALLILRRRNGR